jgi:hypothetical protein
VIGGDNPRKKSLRLRSRRAKNVVTSTRSDRENGLRFYRAREGARLHDPLQSPSAAAFDTPVHATRSREQHRARVRHRDGTTNNPLKMAGSGADFSATLMKAPALG